MKGIRAIHIAIVAVMIAVTAVFTMLVRVPIPATQGYFNFSDVAVYFAAFTFGPIVGLVAGGVGAAIADLLGGFPQWAVLTLLAHGAQGLVAGLLGWRRGALGMVLAWLAGTVAMAGIYFLGEGLLLMGWGPAVLEIPTNLLQNVVGGLVGIPLFLAVRRVYPAVTELARPPHLARGLNAADGSSLLMARV